VPPDTVMRRLRIRDHNAGPGGYELQMRDAYTCDIDKECYKECTDYGEKPEICRLECCM